MKFCKKCQAETDRYKNGDCKACAKLRTKEWNILNPGKRKISNDEYRANNQEKINAYRNSHKEDIRLKSAEHYKINKEKSKISHAAYYKKTAERQKFTARRWQKANPEKKKANERAWCKENFEKVKAWNRAWQKANPIKVNAITARWKRANPEARRIHGQNRRATKRANGGRLSKGLVGRLFKLQRGKCPCCQKTLGNDYHLDHIVPLKLHGLNADDNMQLLRATCNMQKGSKHPVDFMQSKGFLL